MTTAISASSPWDYVQRAEKTLKFLLKRKCQLTPYCPGENVQQKEAPVRPELPPRNPGFKWPRFGHVIGTALIDNIFNMAGTIDRDLRTQN